MSGLEPVEPFIRAGERPDPGASLVVRGRPLTVEGLLRNADATRCRYSLGGEPLAAVSAEVTADGWSLDAILAGPRMRTRSRYATAPVLTLLGAGFGLLATFARPHYSVVLPSYTDDTAQLLLDALGPVLPNPHYAGRLR